MDGREPEDIPTEDPKLLAEQGITTWLNRIELLMLQTDSIA